MNFQYVLRHYKSGIQCGFLAHPSFVQEEELCAITGPLSIAAAERDDIFPVTKRHESEDILKRTKQAFQINLFSGVEHGFAIRSDPRIKTQQFARTQAFLQALAWFGNHLVDTNWVAAKMLVVYGAGVTRPWPSLYDESNGKQFERAKGMLLRLIYWRCSSPIIRQVGRMSRLAV
jgi:hypothetical protein